MEKGLIIGRNYLDEKNPITKDDKGLPITEGQIGQQSEKIYDRGVSRLHVLMTKTGNSQYPFHVKLLKRESTLIIDGKTYIEKDINGNEKIELGKYKYSIDLPQAIANLNYMDNNKNAYHTELPFSDRDGVSDNSTNIQSQIIDRLGVLFPDSLFKLANVSLVVLLVLAIVSKGHPTIHVIVLFLLVIVLLGDIYLYTKNKHK